MIYRFFMIYFLWLTFLSNGHASLSSEPLADGLLTSDIQYWIEPTYGEAFDWQQAYSQAIWTPAEGELNFGYQYEQMWVKQEIEAIHSGHWFFQIRYPLLDKVDFYLLQEGRLIQEVKTGDTRIFHSRQNMSPDFVFDLHAFEPSKWTLLIRIQTEGTLMMPYRWLDLDQYQNRLDQQQLIYGAFYGILLVMATYNLFIFLTIREPAYLFYVFSVLSLMLLQFSFDGRGFLWFWPEHPHVNRFAFPVAYCLYQLSVLSFMMAFIQPKQYSHWLHRYFNVLRGVVVVNLILQSFVPYSHIVPFIVIVGMLSVFSGMLVGAYLWYKGNVSARYFTLAWTLFIVGLLILNLRGFGFFESQFVVVYWYLFGAVLEILLLSFSLADRIARTQQEKNNAEQKLIKSQCYHLETLKRYQDLYENSPIGNFQADENFKVLSVNSACARIFNFNSPMDLVLAMSDIRKFVLSPIEEFYDLVKKVREDRMVVNRELQFKDKQGQPLWLTITMRLEEREREVLLVGAVIDVTKRKMTEQINLRLEKERLQVVEQFSLGIAKEINTPLGSNVATTAFIRDSCQDILKLKSENNATMEDYDGFLMSMEKSLNLLQENQKRITKVVKRFREVSAQHFGLQLHQFSLSELLEEIIANSRWKLAGWRIHLNCAEDLNMCSYSKAIAVIIDQLLDNATVHGHTEKRKDPVVWIDVHELDMDRILIRVRDNGPSIKKDLVDKLCQPFFTTKRGPKGHIGLGLYMVFNLVNRVLNGFVTFPRGPESGFIIEMDIPKSLDAD